jgi:hypothetical protein
MQISPNKSGSEHVLAKGNQTRAALNTIGWQLRNIYFTNRSFPLDVDLFLFSITDTTFT